MRPPLCSLSAAKLTPASEVTSHWPRPLSDHITGPVLLRPKRLVLMILFGFEVDTLEIALREQLKFVEKVFIVESTLTHKGVSF